MRIDVIVHAVVLLSLAILAGLNAVDATRGELIRAAHATVAIAAVVTLAWRLLGPRDE